MRLCQYSRSLARCSAWVVIVSFFSIRFSLPYRLEGDKAANGHQRMARGVGALCRTWARAGVLGYSAHSGYCMHGEHRVAGAQGFRVWIEFVWHERSGGKLLKGAEKMKSTPYCFITGCIFGIIGIVHLMRAVWGTPILAGAWEVPMWVSWVGCPVTLSLCIWAFTLVSKSK